jgi:RNA polymerase sigma factor (sigma-70 family)
MQRWDELLGRAQDGDLKAFDALVRQFRDMAVGYAYALLSDFHLAEDAAQEAFVQAFRDLRMLRSPQAFPAWLRRLVFKHCDRLTRKKSVATVPLDRVELPDERVSSPLDLLGEEERRQAVLQSIEGLPETERTTTTLFYIDGYSMADVGQFLDVPVSTVKSRLHSARRKLRKRMVAMVKDTLQSHTPGEEFNEQVRRVLEQVPLVSFELHQEPPQDGLPRCPESIPFPSCLRAWLQYVGDDLGWRKITAHGQSWRLDKTYVFLMGTTGCAFRLTWKPGWHLDNPALCYMSDDSEAPLRRGFESVGYSWDIIRKQDEGVTEADMRARVVQSISQGRPVIARGVVGPPVECVVTGFDESGAVLLGWSFFQQAREFSDDVEFESSGYFRKRNWFDSTDMVITLGDKYTPKAPADIYRDALEWALQVVRTPLVHGDRKSGLAAYQGWADAIRQDQEFANKSSEQLRYLYDVHQDAVGTVAESRWYAHNFLNQVQEDVAVPAALTKAAGCYDREHSLMWQVWGLVGGPGASDDTARQFADPAVRSRTADLILEARDADVEAAEWIQQALQEW